MLSYDANRTLGWLICIIRYIGMIIEGLRSNALASANHSFESAMSWCGTVVKGLRDVAVCFVST